jgi:hypothetical protein
MKEIEEKNCFICKQTKSISEFRRDKSRRDGFHPYCKTCQLTYRRKDPNNLVRIEGERRRHRKYYYESTGKETSLEYGRSTKGKIKAKQYSQSEKGIQSRKKSYVNIVESGYLKRYHKEKYDNDVCFKIRHNLSGRVREALKHYSNKKNESIKSLIGCTLDELIFHLESQFKENMNWENYGMYGWHIDHIVPCSSFDLTIEENQRICFHYLNLQPLWRNENCYIKGSKIPENKDEIINTIKNKLELC